MVVITLGRDKRGLVLLLFSERVDGREEGGHEVVPRIASKLRIADTWDVMLSKVQNSWSSCDQGDALVRED